MSKVLSLVQKKLDQVVVDMGVVPFPDRVELLAQLTFHTNPSLDELENRADVVADMAKKVCDQFGYTQVLVGSASYFTPFLLHSLIERDLEPVFLFLEREFDRVTGKGTAKYAYIPTGFVRPYKEMFEE